MTDAQSVIRAVNRAEEVHFILEGMKRVKLSHHGPTVDTSGPPSAPVNLGMLDLAEDIRASLQGWSQLVNEEQGDPYPRDETTALALFLRQHAIWIADGTWATDMVEELEGMNQRAIGMLGMLPRRTKIPEHCECGAEQWVYHESVAFVRCADGHVASLADHAYAADTEGFSVTQVARILGVSRSTIGRMIDRGDLHAEGRPPVVPRHALQQFRDALAS
ncbi:helix-turn-helix domain-containing protein [Brachybacterium subflavum]|uniref:helix-turn-helix domain-containing protein n=1 Tax=Brachybacterium subflavum TaxID=2585206 RepID=UPI0012666E4D|nr:helix-turn-helix domain-containing protein [Brachybacterium subflavum]